MGATTRAAYQRAWRQRARERGPREHGTWSSYTNYGCRCSECKAAQQRIWDERRTVKARRISRHSKEAA